MRNSFQTNLTQKRYDRIAFLYNFMEAPAEHLRFARWRSRLRQKIRGKRALEIGVGTGKNFSYYPNDVKITAIDLSSRMLARALRRARRIERETDILKMDAQRLGFPDQFFDTVFATFVFCSVPDPVAGLQELRRVCKPGGRLLLLEHMRPQRPAMGFVFDTLNPMIVRLTGANINRRTMDNLRTAGWRVTLEEMLASDIVRWIEAVPE